MGQLLTWGREVQVGVVPSEGASEKALSERPELVEPASHVIPPIREQRPGCLDYLTLQGLLHAQPPSQRTS